MQSSPQQPLLYHQRLFNPLPQSSDEDSKYESLTFSPLSTSSNISGCISQSEDSQSIPSSDTSGSSTVYALELQQSATDDQQEEFFLGTNYYGYKLVGDNVDKTVRPSFQRDEHRSLSLHHFHAYGVKDRIPTASLSDATPASSTPDPYKLLPSPEDIDCLKEEMSILLSRYIYIYYIILYYVSIRCEY